MWFTYDSELGGFETFETEQEARENLADNIQYWEDAASSDGEWSDNSECVYIGEVKERSHLKPVDDGDSYYSILEMKSVS